MLEDIKFDKVEGVAIAVIPKQAGDPAKWDVYLLNLKDSAIEQVLVRSKGYGNYEGKEVETSTLRQYYEEVAPNNYTKLELIKENLLGLHNEFWISFRYRGQVYDKKYIFVPESIIPDNLTSIPLLQQQGVMIK
jgi:hypothetical protein